MREPKTPLTLDRVMEGRPFAARGSRLLNLPLEVLSTIIRYLDSDKEALAQLALVNSDCRQLARSCQFRALVFDSSPPSTHLLGILIYEAAERSRSPRRLTDRLSLGACIRSIKVNASYYQAQVRALREANKSRDREDSETEEADHEQWGKKLRDLSVSRTRAYEPGLAFVISSLPHLGTVDWIAGTKIDASLLNCLGASTAKHLQLHGVIASENLAVTKTSWPLESLDICIAWDLDLLLARDSVDSSSFWRSLLQACSSTLQRLRIDHSRFALENKDKRIEFDAEFPRLKHLQIDSETQLCPSSLRSLLKSKQLSTIILSMIDSAPQECLEDVGHKEALEALVLTWCPMPGVLPLQIVQDNPQLTVFGALYALSPTLLEPVISALGNFSNLKALSLHWEGTAIPQSSLVALSSLETLERLHITSGNHFGWNHDWFVDHENIRSTLCTLRELRKLILTRDSYQINNGLTHQPGAYYHTRIPAVEEMEALMQYMPEDMELSDRTELLWEVSHWLRMKLNADKYVSTFEKLEWIHLGQISFPIVIHGPDRKRVAVPDREEREPTFPAIEEILGIVKEDYYAPFCALPPLTLD